MLPQWHPLSKVMGFLFCAIVFMLRGFNSLLSDTPCNVDSNIAQQLKGVYKGTRESIIPGKPDEPIEVRISNVACTNNQNEIAIEGTLSLMDVKIMDGSDIHIPFKHLIPCEFLPHYRCTIATYNKASKTLHLLSADPTEGLPAFANANFNRIPIKVTQFEFSGTTSDLLSGIFMGTYTVEWIPKVHGPNDRPISITKKASIQKQL